jgi:tRNA threonylcarbamoyladenosine biosynthesis protein TsaE
LAEPYQVRLGGQAVETIHFDLYRMASPEEFLEAGFRDYFNHQTVCLVEWPEKGDKVLPPPDMHVLLQVSGQGREVELHALSDLGIQCLDRLRYPPSP